MPNIKLELTSDDAIALRAFAGAFNQIADAHDGDAPARAPRADSTAPTPPAPEAQASEPQQQQQQQQDAPAPPAPAPAPAPEAGDSGATLDKNGLPWDSRIHAKSKQMNADGTWRTRRKPKDQSADEWKTYVDTVEGELRRALAGHPIPPAPEAQASEPPAPAPAPEAQDAATAFGGNTTAAPEPPAPVPTPAPEAQASEPQQQDTPEPPAPAPTPAPEAQGDNASRTFQELMQLITSNPGVLTIDAVNEVLHRHGVQAIPLLANAKPELIPTVYTELEAKVNNG